MNVWLIKQGRVHAADNAWDDQFLCGLEWDFKEEEPKDCPTCHQPWPEPSFTKGSAGLITCRGCRQALKGK